MAIVPGAPSVESTPGPSSNKKNSKNAAAKIEVNGRGNKSGSGSVFVPRTAATTSGSATSTRVSSCCARQRQNCKSCSSCKRMFLKISSTLVFRPLFGPNFTDPREVLVTTMYAIAFGAVVLETYLAFRHFHAIPLLQAQALSLKTESGFYYSFYEWFWRSESWWTAIQEILEDTRSEYPTKMNALSRFNIWQEILLAAVFRFFTFTCLPKLCGVLAVCHWIVRGSMGMNLLGWISWIAAHVFGVKSMEQAMLAMGDTGVVVLVRKWIINLGSTTGSRHDISTASNEATANENEALDSLFHLPFLSWEFYKWGIFILNGFGQLAIVAICFELTNDVDVFVNARTIHPLRHAPAAKNEGSSTSKTLIEQENQERSDKSSKNMSADTETTSADIEIRKRRSLMDTATVRNKVDSNASLGDAKNASLGDAKNKHTVSKTPSSLDVWICIESRPRVAGFCMAFLTLVSIFVNRGQISRLLIVTGLNLRENWGLPCLALEVWCLLRFLVQKQTVEAVHTALYHAALLGADAEHKNTFVSQIIWKLQPDHSDSSTSTSTADSVLNEKQLRKIVEETLPGVYFTNQTSIWQTKVLFCLGVFLSILFWQFTPFVLLLQVSALFLIYLFRGISWASFNEILNCFLGAYLLATTFLFFNELMLGNYFLCQLVCLKLVLLTSRYYFSLDRDEKFGNEKNEKGVVDGASSPGGVEDTTSFRGRDDQYGKNVMVTNSLDFTRLFFKSKVIRKMQDETSQQKNSTLTTSESRGNDTVETTSSVKHRKLNINPNSDLVSSEEEWQMVERVGVIKNSKAKERKSKNINMHSSDANSVSDRSKGRRDEQTNTKNRKSSPKPSQQPAPATRTTLVPAFHRRRIAYFFLEGCGAVALFVFFRVLCSFFFSADGHIVEILCAKLKWSQYPCPEQQSFNARLYLTMGVFGFISQDTLDFYWDTRATQFCVSAVLCCAFGNLAWFLTWVFTNYRNINEGMEDDPSGGHPNDSLNSKGVERSQIPVPPTTNSTRMNAGTENEKSRLEQQEDPPSRSTALSAEVLESTLSKAWIWNFFVAQTVLWILLGGFIARLRAVFGPYMLILASGVVLAWPLLSGIKLGGIGKLTLRSGSAKSSQDYREIELPLSRKSNSGAIVNLHVFASWIISSLSSRFAAASHTETLGKAVSTANIKKMAAGQSAMGSRKINLEFLFSRLTTFLGSKNNGASQSLWTSTGRGSMIECTICMALLCLYSHELFQHMPCGPDSHQIQEATLCGRLEAQQYTGGKDLLELSAFVNRKLIVSDTHTIEDTTLEQGPGGSIRYRPSPVTAGVKKAEASARISFAAASNEAFDYELEGIFRTRKGGRGIARHRFNHQRALPMIDKHGVEQSLEMGELDTSDRRVVIATAMSVAGPLRLFTKADIVIHPHYESEQLRKRVFEIDNYQNWQMREVHDKLYF